MLGHFGTVLCAWGIYTILYRFFASYCRNVPWIKAKQASINFCFGISVISDVVLVQLWTWKISETHYPRTPKAFMDCLQAVHIMLRNMKQLIGSIFYTTLAIVEHMVQLAGSTSDWGSLGWLIAQSTDICCRTSVASADIPTKQAEMTRPDRTGKEKTRQDMPQQDITWNEVNGTSRFSFSDDLRWFSDLYQNTVLKATISAALQVNKCWHVSGSFWTLISFGVVIFQCSNPSFVVEKWSNGMTKVKIMGGFWWLWPKACFLHQGITIPCWASEMWREMLQFLHQWSYNMKSMSGWTGQGGQKMRCIWALFLVEPLNKITWRFFPRSMVS